METLDRQKKVLLDFMNDPLYVPMKIKEIAVALNIPKERRPELDAALKELVDEEKISLSKRGKYSIAREKRLTGVFRSHERGFGFVEVPDEEDVFIPAAKTAGAFFGDTVEIAVRPGRKGERREGRIVRIREHGITEIVGTFKKHGSFGYVIADNSKITRDLYIPGPLIKGASDGDKVVAAIRDYGNAGRNPEGKIDEILGKSGDPKTDILSILRAYGVPVEFPDEVKAQAENIDDTVSENDMKGRLDLRAWKTVTIDGEDAKDLDDAVSVLYDGNHYTLGVHIADVSHYVPEGSPIDIEAVRRTSSVYPPDRVVPMLPEKLSNGICSLNEGKDRLAVSCIMEIDASGAVIGHTIAETVIRVDRRMSYDKVSMALDGDTGAASEYSDYLPLLKEMGKLSRILRGKRLSRGAIDFDFPECRILLDDQGFPVDIVPYERNFAAMIIEDFMLAANETVAEDYFWQDIPFLYRNHDRPDVLKMKQLSVFLRGFGCVLRISGDTVHPKEIQKVLENVKGKPEEALIERIVLRSMKRASYAPECGGHFGLSAKYYTHFTSPIRRYPDLQIHRIIKENLHGKMNDERISHYEEILPDIALKCSRGERRADEAERDIIKLEQVRYMKNYTGKEYEGTVSGVTEYGMYVELPNTVEGMVRVSDLSDDYYQYSEENYALVGKRTGKRYRPGQRVRVRLMRADTATGNLDFCVASPLKKRGRTTRNDAGENKRHGKRRVKAAAADKEARHDPEDNRHGKRSG